MFEALKIGLFFMKKLKNILTYSKKEGNVGHLAVFFA